MNQIASDLFNAPPPVSPAANLLERYESHARSFSDIFEHLPVLRRLANECSTVIEIGLRLMVSSWGVIQGLSESKAPQRFYLGIDINEPHPVTLQMIKKAAVENGISFNTWRANDLHIAIPQTDLLFIDSLHIYCHLTYELETFSEKVNKYIAIHDTSGPWGDLDDSDYKGDYSEYPAYINRNRRGLWPAVEDFLSRRPEWQLLERRTNCNGLTILKRQRSTI